MIHRGAAEIGGSTVEVEHGGKRIVLDLGLPLSAASAKDVGLPEIRGLTDRDDDLLGVVITHSHPDHYGLIGRIAPQVPIIAGAATARILGEAAFFTPSGLESLLGRASTDGGAINRRLNRNAVPD